MNVNSRRSFIKKAMYASAVPFVMPQVFLPNSFSEEPLSVHIFSKHLQFLDYLEVGKKAAELGFSGVDLTVRPDGHVLPENAIFDLPKAIQEIEKGGSTCTMITTAIDSVNQEYTVDILKSASKNKVSFYRCNWFTYDAIVPLQKTLQNCQNQLYDLSQLNKQLGIIGCYQNHAGTKVGASIWELERLLQNVDESYFGVQYDIRHATVEGALSWENGLRLIHENIKTIVVKDFKWVQKNGVWQIENTPIGEGIVDFNTFFKLLKKYQINVPVSLHLEYDLGGAEKGKRNITISQDKVFQAMQQDLKRIRQFWEEA
jgi:sugar phosphate isomerase/epimerase